MIDGIFLYDDENNIAGLNRPTRSMLYIMRLFFTIIIDQQSKISYK